MSMISKLQTWLLLASMALICLGGCARSNSKILDERERPTSVAVDQSTDVTVAIVNNQPIKKSAFISLLVQCYGRKVLDELILTEIVRQHAAQANVVATDDMVSAELQAVLEDMAPEKSDAQQEALLEYLLQSRGLSRGEFDLLLERRSLLRALIDPNLVVTEQMLQDEYQRSYGRKVQVRKLAVNNLRRLETAKQELQEGGDFTQLVRRISQDQLTLARDGLVEPFGAADEQIPLPIRQAAMNLEQIGQRTPVIAYRDDHQANWWCILQLEKVIPARDTPLAQVRDELTQQLRRQSISRRSLELQRSLRTRSTTEITDPQIP